MRLHLQKAENKSIVEPTSIIISLKKWGYSI